MSTFKATNLETLEVTIYDADTPQSDHLTAAYKLEEIVSPAVSEEVASEAVIDPLAWRIYVGAFFDRFGAAKISILASDDAIVQALIKDASVRKFIGLYEKKTELAEMLAVLVSKGFALDVASILETEPTSEELYSE